MFRLRLIRCVLGAMLLAGLFGCEDGASNDVIGLNGERGLAPESGRDSGVLSSAVPYIDTGIGGVGSDFTPGTLCQSAQRRACSSQCGVQRCVSGLSAVLCPRPATARTMIVMERLMKILDSAQPVRIVRRMDVSQRGP